MHPTILLAAIMCGSAVLITAMALVARLVSLRRLSAPAASSEEIARRLERIEQAVDTSAIEIERLAEANRFLAKLLAGRADAARDPAAPG